MMNSIFRYLAVLLLSLVLINSESYAQSRRGGMANHYVSKSRKANKIFEKARDAFYAKNYEDAEFYLDKTLSFDSSFIEVYILRGQIAMEQHRNYDAIKNYNKAIELNEDFYPKLLYMTATMELDKGLYYSALKHFKAYAKRPDADPSLRRRIENGVDRCDFAIYQIEHPVPFNPINLGPNVNTEFDEYINTISTDDQELIITRLYPATTRNTHTMRGKTEDFFVSYRDADGNWTKIKNLGPVFNSLDNEGAMSIAPDNSIAIFTACYRDEGFGSCDLYISRRKGDKWSYPENMGADVNTRWWETNSTISSDGKTIYFISNRKGGVGKSDIWKAEKDKYGQWGNVQNLGIVVNSKGKEMTPYIHPDGRTLYFASDGHMGMGGMDLFVTHMDENGNWSKPVNMGYPINTIENEMGIIVNAKGNLAYISSQRKGGFGGYDVYNFDLYKEARPDPVTYMRGYVRDAETHKPLEAKFELVNLSSGKTIINSTSDKEKGDFMVIIPVGIPLALSVEKQGYLFYSDNFDVKADSVNLKAYIKNVDLQPLKAGQSVVLKNIFFASGSYELEKESYTELNKLYDLLAHNNTLRVEISGYTDNVGSRKDNILLSQNRAKAVVDYLVQKGIDKSRLIYKGYGESRPVDTNDTEVGRQQNRRTELKILNI
jgi:outer membrane protein OmpA-like peptidoglycan-associated protein/tetratricopeptide (TPR) repeat protein